MFLLFLTAPTNAVGSYNEEKSSIVLTFSTGIFLFFQDVSSTMSQRLAMIGKKRLAAM